MPIAEKKIVVLLGSRPGGNTDSFCRRIEERVAQEGLLPFRFHYLPLAGLSLCEGCERCGREGHDLCPVLDRMGRIWDDIRAADGLIIGGPVIQDDLSPELARFFEKSADFPKVEASAGKPAIAIATTLFSSVKEVLDRLCLELASWGLSIEARLGILRSRYESDELYREQIDLSIGAVAEMLLSALAKPKDEREKSRDQHYLQSAHDEVPISKRGMS